MGNARVRNGQKFLSLFLRICHTQFEVAVCLKVHNNLLGNRCKISIARPSILLAIHWRHIQRLLWILHKFHQATWHVVRSGNSIILLAVFTETNENGVDCHLVNGEKTVADEKCENTANYNRNWRVMKARFVLTKQIKNISKHHSPHLQFLSYLNHFNANQNSCQHNKDFPKKQHKITNRVDRKHSQRICRQNVIGALTSDAKRRAIHCNDDVSVLA